ncbi:MULTISPECIES: TIGR03943 family putative permease subunit [Streptomyces]|uniref:TIGR03943 family protein n=1 Tax=Streptomyces mirabilis TaxID=68239 RepID=A0ABU3UPI8_9ACTN|nr:MULTISPECIES: TIGR03943 family protein [Streptomyces]MDU8995836.1 TIGR03943 family protein [Streptomyces mirabilis]NMI59724.1 TIGR03943 family protein [Streptomyces sp. RLA2-12]QDN58970.1 TIGR03943 family protein [Streptomyces sp. S1D4-20]QDN69035.1 TIGR03943 family protein [Streptomyces sp. S1D4-14]QDO51453.1 TIGR03943 family protein [Streptomyces sp. RLB3-5]
MKRPLQVTLLVLSGLGLLHASLFTDLSLRFVKEGMRPMLVASGVLLLVLGVAEAWSSQKPVSGDAADSHSHDHGQDDGHGHDHSTVPRIAWLLFLPALSLLFYAPPALGAYTAAREAPKAVAEQRYFDPLPATSPIPLTLTQFTSRVQQDHKRDIGGRSVRMTGFVTPDEGADGWYLTRIIFTCCAADAQSVKVRIHGAAALPANTWVTVTGTWHPGGTLGTSSAPAALDARTVKKVAKPVNAYTDALPLF